MMTVYRFPRLPIAALLLAALAGPAGAQCVGDCNGDGSVAINELITGVNNALGSCTAVTPTATTTVTPTPTTSVTPVPTSEICAQPSNSCGDGVPDVLSKTETCDDGNTIDDDGCPSDCCVTPCSLMQDRPYRVRVNFAAKNPNVFLVSMNLALRYEDGVIDVPGTDSAPPVIESVTSDIFAVTPRDFNYLLNLILDDPTLVGYDSGTAATVEFKLCDSASQPPPLSSISCTVRDGTDAELNPVPGDQITCTLEAIP